MSDGSQRRVHLGGWRKQLSDARDEAYRLKLPGGFLGTLPTSVDQRSICSPIEDQGELGSCTAHAFAALIESNEIRRTKLGAHFGATAAAVTISNIVTLANGNITFLTTVTPGATPAPTPTPTPTPTPSKLVRVSRLFEYYASRKIENSVADDAGATIRDSIKAGVTYGCCDETLWPYNIAQFAINPAKSVWDAAATHKVTSYHAVADGDLATMKSTLVSGSLITFGFQVYDNMLSDTVARTGLLPHPGKGESLQGGHAVALCGYDDTKIMPDGTKGAFLVRNSWGTSWGLAGYFYMSYNYVSDTSLANDFWVVVSSPI